MTIESTVATLTGDLTAAREEIARLNRTIRALHRPVPDFDGAPRCITCGTDHPCRTIQGLEPTQRGGAS